MRLLALTLAVFLAAPSRAADRERIAALNVAGTALVTYAGCLVQAKLTRTAPKHARCLAAGTVGGVGFYQAKRLAADGHITSGWLVANLATSVVENTAAGSHPLARLGYTFGPFRLRVATPADKARESYVDIDLSLAETGFLTRALLDADDVDIRDGMLWWETRRPDISDDGRVFHGYTWGLYPGVWSGARQQTWNHEAVHAIQALQLDAPEPPLLDLGRKPQAVRIKYVRAGFLNLTDNIAWAQLPYEERWAEIEAYRLADDRQPPE